MANNEIKLEILPYYDIKANAFLIDNKEDIDKAFNDYLSTIPTEIVIQNMDDYKSIKKKKAEINNQVKAISQSRIDFTKLCVGETTSYLSSLEKKLKEASDALNKKIEDFDTNFLGKLKEPSKITLTIKSSDEEKINKVRNFALSLGLEVSIK